MMNTIGSGPGPGGLGGSISGGLGGSISGGYRGGTTSGTGISGGTRSGGGSGMSGTSVGGTGGRGISGPRRGSDGSGGNSGMGGEISISGNLPGSLDGLVCISGGVTGLEGVSISGTWPGYFDGLVGISVGVTTSLTPAGYLHQIDHGVGGIETSIWRGTLHLHAQICELYKEADLLIRKWRNKKEDAMGSELGSSGGYRCRFCRKNGGHAGTSELAGGEVAKARLEDDTCGTV